MQLYYFSYYSTHVLISTRWLELALGLALFFFAARMFKEVIQKEDEERVSGKGLQVRIHHDCKLGVWKMQLHWLH